MVYFDLIIFSLQKSGGISVYFSHILQRFTDSKLKSQSLLYPNKNKNLSEVPVSGSLKVKHPLLFLNILRYCDCFAPSNCTIFHSSYYRLPFFWQRKKLKVITTVHDFTYERFIGGYRAALHSWQKKRAVMNSDVIICISKNTKKDLLKYIPAASEKDIRVIYNGVSDTYRRLENFDYKPTTNRIIYVGARGGYKNFKALVSAMALLPKFELVVIGGGLLSESEIKLLENKCHGRYVAHEFVTEDELNRMYNEAHCLAYPSLYEGFGIPAIEAMKAGCPVIAANASSLPEVCGDAGILLDKVDAASISDAVRRLEDEATRRNYIDLGIKNAMRFSWDKMFQELREIYLG